MTNDKREVINELNEINSDLIKVCNGRDFFFGGGGGGGGRRKMAGRSLIDNQHHLRFAR